VSASTLSDAEVMRSITAAAARAHVAPDAV
jgi:hypothetical protein